MTLRIKFLLAITYFPTAILLSLVILSLIAYFLGWRVWIIPVPPETPTPVFQMVT